MTRSEIWRLEKYLRNLFRLDTITIVERPKQADSVEVQVGGEFIGVIFKDEEDGEDVLRVQHGDPGNGSARTAGLARRLDRCDSGDRVFPGAMGRSGACGARGHLRVHPVCPCAPAARECERVCRGRDILLHAFAPCGTGDCRRNCAHSWVADRARGRRGRAFDRCALLSAGLCLRGFYCKRNRGLHRVGHRTEHCLRGRV